MIIQFCLVHVVQEKNIYPVCSEKDVEDLSKWVRRLAITNLLFPLVAIVSNFSTFFVLSFSLVGAIALFLSLSFFLVDYIVNGFVIFGARRYSSHSGLLLVFGVLFLVNSFFLRFYYPLSLVIFRNSELFSSILFSPYLLLSLSGFLFGGVLLVISQDIPFAFVRTHFRIIGATHFLLGPYWFWLFIESLRVEGVAALGAVIAGFPAAVVKVVLLPLYTSYAMNKWHQFLVHSSATELYPSEIYPEPVGNA